MYSPFRWWALLGISLLAFTAFLDVTIVNVALPFIQSYFQASVLELQWVTNIFAMILCMTMITVGKCADLFGRKKIFLIGVAIFAIAAWGAGLSRSMEILIFFRGLQGLGASILFVASATLLTDIFPKNEHPKAVGIYSGITGAGLTIGPALGGFIVGFLDWRWVFWVNIPLIILGLGLCSFSMKTPHSQRRQAVKMDWTGFVLLTVGLAALIYGIIRGAGQGWDDEKTLIPLIVGAVALIMLLIVEDSVSAPLLELSIFKKRLILLTTLSCVVAGIVSFVFILFDPLYLHTVRTLSPFEIGFMVAVIPIGQVFVSLSFPTLLRWMGIANLVILSIVSAFVAALIHCAIGAAFPLFGLVIPFFLLGINWGLSNTCLITSVHQEIPDEKASKALGSVTTLWNLSGSVFLALSSALFALSQKATFQEEIGKGAFKLSQQQVGQLQPLLESASQSVSAVYQIVGKKSGEVLQLFETAFLKAFHLVMEVNTLIIFAILVIAFAVYPTMKRDNKSH